MNIFSSKAALFFTLIALTECPIVCATGFMDLVKDSLEMTANAAVILYDVTVETGTMVGEAARLVIDGGRDCGRFVVHTTVSAGRQVQSVGREVRDACAAGRSAIGDFWANATDNLRDLRGVVIRALP
jgi:hypothetical protein